MRKKVRVLAFVNRASTFETQPLSLASTSCPQVLFGTVPCAVRPNTAVHCAQCTCGGRLLAQSKAPWTYNRILVEKHMRSGGGPTGHEWGEHAASMISCSTMRIVPDISGKIQAAWLRAGPKRRHSNNVLECTGCRTVSPCKKIAVPIGRGRLPPAFNFQSFGVLLEIYVKITRIGARRWRCQSARNLTAT